MNKMNSKIFWYILDNYSCRPIQQYIFIVGSMEAPSKAFLLFFLLPDWLKLNHLKNRMECFRHFFVPYLFHRTGNNRRDKQVLARKHVQKTIFEAAEMILG